MYHAIVRKKIIALFEAIGRGDAEPVLASFAPRFIHKFLGQTAMGGERHSLAATRQWYQRLYRLLPGIKFELGRIAISGPPWNTLAVIEWRESNNGADGVATENFGLHVARLVWGRIDYLAICPDTVGLKQTLDRLAAAGFAEAHAAPIAD